MKQSTKTKKQIVWGKIYVGAQPWNLVEVDRIKNDTTKHLQ